MNLTIAADPDFKALHPKVYLELELSSMDEISTLPNPLKPEPKTNGSLDFSSGLRGLGIAS